MERMVNGVIVRWGPWIWIWGNNFSSSDLEMPTEDKICNFGEEMSRILVGTCTSQKVKHNVVITQITINSKHEQTSLLSWDYSMQYRRYYIIVV